MRWFWTISSETSDWLVGFFVAVVLSLPFWGILYLVGRYLWHFLSLT
ncbi:hypothetical protein [Risungbinella massiliensis]|nr:hypothetical protein [Risungbinella massiliensis]